MAAAKTTSLWSLDADHIRTTLDVLDNEKSEHGVEFKGRFRVWESRWYTVRFNEDINAHEVVF